jgi:hypothetical protein
LQHNAATGCNIQRTDGINAKRDQTGSGGTNANQTNPSDASPSLELGVLRE